ncbi:hypothetical protein TNCV_3107311 [Trichonephila clavipes]|nr:hypothetical protein TNCV_3107311 [Trichonephila clavipes]
MKGTYVLSQPISDIVQNEARLPIPRVQHLRKWNGQLCKLSLKLAIVAIILCLDEIAAIANILKTAPASTVQLLHKIVNDEPYRLNCAGSAKELSKHIFKNLSDLASLKNNFTEQLTDDEDEDSAPFSLDSTNDANKQPLTPPIYHSHSPQEAFVLLLQTQRNQSQRGNEENAFLLKDLFSTMRSFTGNDNYSVKAFFPDVEENFIFIPDISDLQKIICVKRLLQGPAKTFIQTLHNILTLEHLTSLENGTKSNLPSHIEINLGIEVKKPGLKESFLIGGLEGAREVGLRRLLRRYPM